MSNALWYLARGSGVVSLALLTVAMVLGVAGRSGRPAFGLPRFAVSLVHRNAALLSLVLLVVHVTTLSLDPYAQLRLVDLVVPFGSTYRPMWVGLGALAADVTIALIVTSLARHRIGARAWRAVHWLAYASWPVAFVHGIGSGTDGGTGWYLVFAVTCAAAVAVALVWRCMPGFTTLGGRRVPRTVPVAPVPATPTRTGASR